MYFPNQYFDRSEFACKCGCGFNVVDAELYSVLMRLREHFAHKRKITITSGARCLPHNIFVGGSHKSQHLYGKAADIKVEGVSPVHIYHLLNQWYPDKYGIGLYLGWVHIDVRYTKARWTNLP